ncbi:uncharacterized protein BKA78DRAFT_347944 [Phyllosticta capitalensis]|uniref:uncharacterized protein n=1 Tax=Phyllosticta capitalensis TaxID=121624 RepID=UPI0031320E44
MFSLDDSASRFHRGPKFTAAERKFRGLKLAPPSPGPPSFLQMSRMEERYPPNALEGDQEIVTIEVGEEGRVFRMHKSVLSEVSQFFVKAFKGDFKEGKERKMKLADVEPEVFKIIGHWIYTRELPAYIFAEVYLIEQLAKDIHCCYRERYRSNTSYPRAITIMRVFKNVREDASLCQLFVERFSNHWDPLLASAIDKKLYNELPQSFALKCMLKFSDKLKKRSGASSASASPRSSAKAESKETARSPLRFDLRPRPIPLHTPGTVSP